MEQVKYKFSTKMRILTASYETIVSVYEDRVVIKRIGRTGGLPSDSTISFRDATAISWGNAVGRSWITFTIPGTVTRGAQYVTTVRPGQFAFSGPYIPYEDPFSIVFGLYEVENAEYYFRKIKKLFDTYKTNTATEQNTVSNTTIYQDGVMDKLRKLKELKDLDILNEEEYEEKRIKLLSEI